MPRMLTSFYQEELQALIDDLEHVQEIESDMEEEKEDEMLTMQLRNRRAMITYLKEQYLLAVRLGCSKEKALELKAVHERTALEANDDNI